MKLHLSATEIALRCKNRWQVVSFFKWIGRSLLDQKGKVSKYTISRDSPQA